ncbi:MAG TPA: efflux RND transporter periplasmic adaptor subunit [Polyangiales bacterium]|nr:efflux RND transporter periplasmic adaptor subunit [Polyangiales bacterium]
MTLVLVFVRTRDHGATGSGHQAELYTCSMHPSIQSATAGSCPICGMNLTPVTPEQAASETITVDEARQHLGGVTTAAAKVAPMSTSFTAAGKVAYEESSLSDVTLRVPGYVTVMHVQALGQEVREGDPLLTMQSPELYAAQRELLAAAHHARHTAREKLTLLGMTDAQIEALLQSGVAQRDFVVHAQTSGFVIGKEIVTGTYVKPGQRAFRLAATNKVWIEADVDDRDLPDVHLGQTAHFTLDYMPGRIFEGKVIHLYGYLETSSRTGRVRLSADNPVRALRPGQLVIVKFESDAGQRLQVPVSSILYTGPRRLVFVREGDDMFRPQEVRVGRQVPGMVEVVDGLQAGQVVATSGTFMLAAEARITTKTPYFDRATAEPAGAAHDDEHAPSAHGASTDQAAALELDAHSPTHNQPQPDAPAHVAPPSAPEASPAARATKAYVCPMHPDEQADGPAKCSKCGMNLEPVKRSHD